MRCGAATHSPCGGMRSRASLLSTTGIQMVGSRVRTHRTKAHPSARCVGFFSRDDERAVPMRSCEPQRKLQWELPRDSQVASVRRRFAGAGRSRCVRSVIRRCPDAIPATSTARPVGSTTRRRRGGRCRRSAGRGQVLPATMRPVPKGGRRMSPSPCRRADGRCARQAGTGDWARAGAEPGRAGPGRQGRAGQGRAGRGGAGRGEAGQEWVRVGASRRAGRAAIGGFPPSPASPRPGRRGRHAGSGPAGQPV